MTQAEVERANRSIQFEMLRPPVGVPNLGAGMGGMGMAPPGFDPSTIYWRSHNPNGRGLLRREGGQTDLIAAHLLNQGRFCLEREVPSQMMLRSEKDKEQQNFFLIKMAKMAGGDEWARAKPIEKNISLPTCHQEIPEFKLKKDVQRLHSAIQDWAAVLLRREADERCKNPAFVNEPLKTHSKRYNFGGFLIAQQNDEESRSDIKSLLDRQRPFALHYNPCILQNCTPDKASGTNSWHASMVVGRRWNNLKNRCELKIKNSWGASCENALPSVECKKGYWWVDQRDIVSRPHEIIWIDKK